MTRAKHIPIILSAGSIFFAIAGTTAFAAVTSTNLILNPSFETATVSGTPDHWNQGVWGTNKTTFTYPVAGLNGGVGANVAMTSSTSGDAKWYFDNVSVTPGTQYAFSDSYNSTVSSLLVAQFTSKTNTLSYVQFDGTLPSTNGTWANASTTFTPPTDTTAVTIFHLIQAGGSLTTDNYFLGPIATSTPPPPPPPPPSPTPTSTLTVKLTESGGTATSSNFNLMVKNGTSTLLNGIASPSQLFILNVGSSYNVTEATTTASANYTIALNPNCSGTIGTSSVICAITNTFVPPAPTSTPTSTANLILNPSLTKDTIASGTPDQWNQGGWGTNATAFNYPVAGVNGGIGANVTISSFTDGDAKWYFNNVFITSGATYTFSDSYNANVPSSLVVQFTSSNGSITYSQLASLTATNGAWATTTQTITAPATATAMTIFHFISSIGSLTTTNYSLALASNGGGGSELFSKGLVSITFDDGWQSQYDNALPILQAANMHGTFYIISDGMKNTIATIFPSSDNPFTVATTSKTAVWSPIYTDPTQHSFIFSDTYTATGPSTITVRYKISGGGASSTVLGPLPAGTNATANFSFGLPVITGPLTITQAVTGSKTLVTSNVLLTQPVGYMDVNHVLAMQAAGEEIGNHTVNHCDLVAIFKNATNTASCAVTPPSSTTVQNQINNAHTALVNAGFSPIDTLAYPYGSGAGNANVENITKASGLIAARGVDSGYNTKTTDHYALLDQNIDASTTDPAAIQQWIDYAAANKVWLILTLHQVELSTSTITKNKEVDATTARILQSTVNYLASQRTAGKITVDTVHNIMTQYMQ